MHEHNETMGRVCCDSVVYATLLDRLILSVYLVSLLMIYFQANALSLLFLVCPPPLSYGSLIVIYVNVKELRMDLYFRQSIDCSLL